MNLLSKFTTAIIIAVSCFSVANAQSEQQGKIRSSETTIIDPIEILLAQQRNATQAGATTLLAATCVFSSSRPKAAFVDGISFVPIVIPEISVRKV